jgi:hypothetical protein
LASLGLNDRPTLDKCKKIKEKREVEQELAGLDTSNIILNERRGSRRSGTSDSIKKPMKARDDLAALQALGSPE